MADSFFILIVVCTATLFALLEIQIEGGAGWAEKLPTWRIRNRWTHFFLGARPVTGYHFYFQLFVFSLGHLPYAMGVHPSWSTELRILAFLIFFWVLEDFLWFVFNPEYGIRRFRREMIWWHAETWWWFMPRDYWIFLPIGMTLYVLSQ